MWEVVENNLKGRGVPKKFEGRGKTFRGGKRIWRRRLKNKVRGLTTF